MKRSLLFLILFFSSSNLFGTILILDYGSPITPYIRYCLQGAQVHCLHYAHSITDQQIRAIKPKGVILSGGPFSVYEQGSPQAPALIFELGVPILGICYGQQLMCHQLDGTVTHMPVPERGPTELTIIDTCLLTDSLCQPGDVLTIWMGHGDRIVKLPEQFRTIAYTAGSPYAIIADDLRKWYGVQFHPEAPKNSWHELIKRFALEIAGELPDKSVVREDVTMDEVELYRSLLYGCCSHHQP